VQCLLTWPSRLVNIGRPPGRFLRLRRQKQAIVPLAPRKLGMLLRLPAGWVTGRLVVCLLHVAMSPAAELIRLRSSGCNAGPAAAEVPAIGVCSARPRQRRRQPGVPAAQAPHCCCSGRRRQPACTGGTRTAVPCRQLHYRRVTSAVWSSFHPKQDVGSVRHGLV